jgi:hypothetical protein
LCIRIWQATDNLDHGDVAAVILLFVQSVIQAIQARKRPGDIEKVVWSGSLKSKGHGRAIGFIRKVAFFDDDAAIPQVFRVDALVLWAQLQVQPTAQIRMSLKSFTGSANPWAVPVFKLGLGPFCSAGQKNVPRYYSQVDDKDQSVLFLASPLHTTTIFSHMNPSSVN